LRVVFSTLNRTHVGSLGGYCATSLIPILFVAIVAFVSVYSPEPPWRTQ
jgi:hypothetical protein